MSSRRCYLPVLACESGLALVPGWSLMTDCGDGEGDGGI